MKTVCLRNGVVQEIIPEYALPVEKWYGVEFAKQCVEAPDEVEQGYTYNPETQEFSNPKIRTLEDLRAEALERISGKCSAAIASGVIVDGKRYLLRKYDDQNALTAALEKVRNGAETVPFKAYGDVLPQPYTAAQIETIVQTAEEWGQVNLGYRALLEVWRLRETDADVLKSIDYGVPLPDDLMQELGENLALYGINIADYMDKFGQEE